jgi:UDP-N-acetylmuramyl pentapeptide phosphotransferase/UDP-N-acetylglucosamine-1-phosphate transferase
VLRVAGMKKRQYIDRRRRRRSLALVEQSHTHHRKEKRSWQRQMPFSNIVALWLVTLSFMIIGACFYCVKRIYLFLGFF